MKRIVQIFAITLIALLAAGPASAAASCILGSAAMGASCPMGMARMDPGCPMSHALAAADCSPDCCNRAQPQAIVIPGAPANSKTAAPVTPGLRLLAIEITGSSVQPEPVLLVVASSPPLYLRLQVFRI